MLFLNIIFNSQESLYAVLGWAEMRRHWPLSEFKDNLRVKSTELYIRNVPRLYISILYYLTLHCPTSQCSHLTLYRQIEKMQTNGQQ